MQFIFWIFYVILRFIVIFMSCIKYALVLCGFRVFSALSSLLVCLVSFSCLFFSCLCVWCSLSVSSVSHLPTSVSPQSPSQACVISLHLHVYHTSCFILTVSSLVYSALSFVSPVPLVCIRSSYVATCCPSSRYPMCILVLSLTLLVVASSTHAIFAVLVSCSVGSSFNLVGVSGFLYPCFFFELSSYSNKPALLSSFHCLWVLHLGPET